MKHLAYIFMAVVLLGSWSCKKAPAPGDCFKTTGSLTKEERAVSEFHNVVLKNNVNLYLKNGVTNKITVEAGKNLQEKIKTNVNEKGDLVISNENRCNWIRNYDTPVNVYLEYHTIIDTLFYASIGDVANFEGIDTLYFGNKFCVQIGEGAGTLKMNLKTGFLRLVFNYGTCDVDFSGRADIVSVYSAAWGKVDLTGVDCPKVWSINNSSNDMFLYSSEELEATTGALGNIFIAGNPAIVNFSKQGEGDLIYLP